MKNTAATLFAFFLLLLSAQILQAQENKVARMPEIGNEHVQNVYTSYNHGFWIAPEATVAYTCRIANKNMAFAEISATGGYRFNEFFRVGLGFGGRCYFLNSGERYYRSRWSFPIFANVRGNFIPTDYRDVVPYYSVDLGATVRDGFMVRPTVGLRIGQNRSAMLIGLSYIGQATKLNKFSDAGERYASSKFLNCFALRIGYEF